MESMAEVVVARLFGASWIWKANLETVLVEDSRLRRVSGIPGVPEATVTLMVVVAKEIEEEALRLPLIIRRFPASNVSLAVARRKSVESKLSKVPASPPPPAKIQLPFKSAKQPLVILMPLAKVEVAEEEALSPPKSIVVPLIFTLEEADKSPET